MHEVQTVGAAGSHRKHPLLRRLRAHVFEGHFDCAVPYIDTIPLYLALMVSMSRQLSFRFLRTVMALCTVIVNEMHKQIHTEGGIFEDRLRMDEGHNAVGCDVSVSSGGTALG